ncbi:MAG: phosphoenolpyruvate carboxykinase (ATP), partial [bacterium]|nr:phosphoenolpyruvate carboxykinase (ATP) [bacterium]
MHLDLSAYGLAGPEVVRNPSVAQLYTLGLQEAGCALAGTGALIAMSNVKTGRSPKDKRIVDDPASHDNIWWGPINIPIGQEGFAINRETAIDFLRTRDRLFCIDGFAGWDPNHQITVRIICA